MYFNSKGYKFSAIWSRKFKTSNPLRTKLWFIGFRVEISLLTKRELGIITWPEIATSVMALVHEYQSAPVVLNQFRFCQLIFRCTETWVLVFTWNWHLKSLGHSFFVDFCNKFCCIFLALCVEACLIYSSFFPEPVVSCFYLFCYFLRWFISRHFLCWSISPPFCDSAVFEGHFEI